MKAGRWHFCLVLAALCALPLLMAYIAKMLIWQRDMLNQGAWWLVFTAHFIHIDKRHLLFNLIGLFLLSELLWDQITMSDALILFIVSAFGVSMLLWLLQPGLVWYAGLSGVLHGLWAGFAGAGWLRTRSGYFCVALLALVCKLILMPDALSNVPVIHAAHRYGACSGLLGLVLIRLKQLVYKLD